MIKLLNGDEVEVSGVKYRVIDGELMKVDDRSPLEAKVDDLEARIKELEARPQWSFTSGTEPDYYPYNPYTPWKDTTSAPVYPSWTTCSGGGTQI